CAAAAVALFVFSRKGHFDFKKSLAFAAWVMVGAFTGSRLSPLVPPRAFFWILLFTCPLILWIVWEKDLWVAREMKHPHPREVGPFSPSLVIAGLTCGLYDGIWGPGAGTFMMLALLFVARFPLLPAL